MGGIRYTFDSYDRLQTFFTSAVQTIYYMVGRRYNAIMDEYPVFNGENSTSATHYKMCVQKCGTILFNN